MQGPMSMEARTVPSCGRYVRPRAAPKRTTNHFAVAGCHNRSSGRLESLFSAFISRLYCSPYLPTFEARVSETAISYSSSYRSSKAGALGKRSLQPILPDVHMEGRPPADYPGLVVAQMICS